MEQKKWYQSKIVIAAVLAIGSGIYELTNNLAVPTLTPEQIQAVSTVAPTLIEEIKEVKAGGSVQGLLNAGIGIAIMLFRVFATSTTIALPFLKK